MSIDLSMFQDENGNIAADKVDAIKSAFEKQTQGLAENKESILAEKKKLQDRMKLFEGIDPERARKLEAEYEELQAKLSETDNDATAIKKALEKKFGKQIDEYEEKLNNYKSKYETKVIDETLTAELEKIGITNPAYKKSVKALMRDNVKLQDDTVLLGEETVDTYIKKWSETEEAKAFITPAQNAGGGYKKTSGISHKNFSQMTSSEKAKLMNEVGLKEYQKLATTKGE